jgi:hypothetical protein
MEQYYRSKCLPYSPGAIVPNVGIVLTTLLDIEARTDIEPIKECHINVYDYMEYYTDSFTTIYAVYALLFAVGRKRSAYCPRQGLKILNFSTSTTFKFSEQKPVGNWWDSIIQNAMSQQLRAGYMRQQGAKIIKLAETSSLLISFRNRHIYSNITTVVSNGRIESKNLLYPAMYTVLVGLAITVPVIAEYRLTALSTRNIDTFSLVFSLLVIASTIVPIVAAAKGDAFTWSRLVTGNVCLGEIDIDALGCVVCELTALTEQYDANELFGSGNTCAIANQPRGNTSFSRPLYAYEAQLLGVLLLYDPSRAVYCAYDDRRRGMRAVLMTDGPQGCKFHVTASWPGNTSRLMSCDANRLVVGCSSGFDRFEYNKRLASDLKPMIGMAYDWGSLQGFEHTARSIQEADFSDIETTYYLSNFVYQLARVYAWDRRGDPEFRNIKARYTGGMPEQAFFEACSVMKTRLSGIVISNATSIKNITGKLIADMDLLKEVLFKGKSDKNESRNKKFWKHMDKMKIKVEGSRLFVTDRGVEAFPLNGKMPRYVAISWVWRDNDANFEMLQDLLRASQRLLGVKCIWWDILTVPVDNKIKIAFLNDMGYVYSNALYTIAYMGEEDSRLFQEFGSSRCTHLTVVIANYLVVHPWLDVARTVTQ